jgi:hypothetical protein
MEQSPSSEANSHSASQNLPIFHGTLRFITELTKDRHFSVSRATCLQSTIFHPNSHSNIILTSTLISSGWSLLFRVSNQNVVCVELTSQSYVVNHYIIYLTNTVYLEARIFCVGFELSDILCYIPN